MSKRVAIYCRVSSHEQEKNLSLPTQEERCRAHASEKGWGVVGVESEVHSGADLNGREGLQRALALIENGGADILLVFATDRLCREQLHIGVILDRVLTAGASLQFVTEDFENSATGKFLLTARTFAAEMELAKIRERTQRGRRARVASGKPIVTKRPPFGYLWNADKSGYVIDHDTAPIVRMIFEAYLDGATLRGVCAMLEERGILSPTGRLQWTSPAIRQVITRSIYSGTGTAYATVATRRPGGGYDRRLATPEERTLLPGIAPAIVTPEEHALAQSILERNKANASRNNRDPEATLLRAGFIRCGHCGWQMNVNNAPPSAPGFSPAYHCNARSKRAHACPQPSISASVIDPVVWERVSEVLRDPAVIERALAAHRNDGGLDRDLAALDARLEAIATKQANIASALGSVDDPEPIIAQLNTLSAAKKTMEADRADLVRRMADVDADRARVRTLTEWAAHFGKKLDSATYEQKRTALEALGVSVRVFCVGATDEDGNALPRWEVTMRPISMGEPIVYGHARCNTPRR